MFRKIVLEFGTSVVVISLPYCGQVVTSHLPVVEETGIAGEKTPPSSLPLATFSHATAGIRSPAVVRDTEESMAAP